MLRGGVHEILPVVILTALAMAFGFIALGYMVNLWGSMENPRNTELLRLGADSVVMPCSTVNGSRVWVVAIQYRNPGLRDTYVYRVEIVGFGWWVVNETLNYTGPWWNCSRVALVGVGYPGLLLRHGSSGWFYVVVPQGIASRLSPGMRVSIRVYTRYGSLFLANVPVEGG